MRLTSLAVLAVLVLAGCIEEPISPVERVARRLDVTPEARAQLTAAMRGRTERGFEDEILRMEARIPGLGGVYLDRNTGQFVVYLKDMSTRAAAMAQLQV